MSIQLSIEQELRIQTVIRQGKYASVNEVMDAALTAVEQEAARKIPEVSVELDELLLEGLTTEELSEDEFWTSVDQSTEAIMKDHHISISA